MAASASTGSLEVSYKGLTHHFAQQSVTGQNGSKNNVSHAEHAWPGQLWQPYFQRCHLVSPGHMKNAGSISHIKGQQRHERGDQRSRRKKGMFLNQTSFITEILRVTRHPFSHTQAQAVVVGCTVFRRKESFGSVLQQRAVISSRYHLGQPQWCCSTSCSRMSPWNTLCPAEVKDIAAYAEHKNHTTKL